MCFFPLFYMYFIFFYCVADKIKNKMYELWYNSYELSTTVWRYFGNILLYFFYFSPPPPFFLDGLH